MEEEVKTTVATPAKALPPKANKSKLIKKKGKFVNDPEEDKKFD